MRTIVCIPWRGGDHDREDALKRVFNFWTEQGLPVYTSDSGPGLFNRARARNLAVEAAGTPTAIIIADADCLVEPQAVARAVDNLQDVIVFPHDHYLRLDANGKVKASSHGIATNGGVLVISDNAWERIGGYDERLSGHGFEDSAFWVAAETLLGLSMHVPGAMTELFHRKSRGRHEGDRELYDRYVAASGNRDAMSALVSEPGRR